MKQLIIAEKPSVAQSISAVLGVKIRQNGYMESDEYIVSWCVGHLIGLAFANAYDEKYLKWCYEDLPIIPQEWKYTVSKDKKAQLQVLSMLMKREDVGTVINACDAGREGELIFRHVYDYCKCDKPIKRLWVSSMEDSALKEGFENLRDGSEYENLYAAALCREKADWLVGINATRLFSVLYKQPLNVGRVMSPTLAMLVQRKHDIDNFVKEPFYTAELDTGGFIAVSERTNDKTQAENICANCNNKAAVVHSVEHEEKKTAPPKLYDLTTLQREANRQWGYTAQQTLDYIQSLYDKKLATYPRTDSRFLTEDMAQNIPVITNLSALMLPGIRGNVAVSVNEAQVINNKKVSDHHAIIPTKNIHDVDLDALPSGERNILYMIALRLLTAVADPHIYSTTTATIECGGFLFTAKGQTIIQNGWKAIEQAYKAALKNEHENEKSDDGKTLPVLNKGTEYKNVSVLYKEGFTAPPKPFTEDTLLSAMERAGCDESNPDVERAGLGTPATRAGVIEKLVKKGFVERKKKQLIPTEKGINLTRILPESLTSAQMTSKWENTLSDIAKGEFSGEAFMKGIGEMSWSLVKQNPAPLEEYKALFSVERPVIGVCPRCGCNVHENSKGFFCAGRDCGFALWKENKYFTLKKKTITKAVAEALIKNGRVKMSGLYSEKSGKTYSAVIIMDAGNKGDKYVSFRMEFPKKR